MRKSLHQRFGSARRFEVLESRQVLSATVTGVITANPGGKSSTLTLTGDKSDSIVVTQASANSFKVQGIATNIKQGSSSASSQTFTAANAAMPIGTIAIRLPNGNNFVQLSGLDISQALGIATGSGNDTIQVLNTTVGGFVSTIGTLSGTIGINAGNGTNALVLNGVTVVQATGAANMNILTGSGVDAVSLINVQSQLISVQTGAGNDTVAINTATVQTVNVQTGDGTDAVSLYAVSADGTAANQGILVNVGAGNYDAVSVVDCSADNAIFIDGNVKENGTIAGSLNHFINNPTVTNFKYRSGI